MLSAPVICRFLPRFRSLPALCALSILAATTLFCAPALATEMPIVAISAEVEVEEERTNLVFTLSEPVDARAFVMSNPDRVIVDLPEVNFQIAPELIEVGGLIASYRFGVFAANRSRIVIDLAGSALVVNVETSIRSSDRAALLRIGLQAAERGAFEEAVARDSRSARESAMTNASLRNLDATPGDERPVIVLDPGHGGIDPGAVAAGGVVEKEIALSFPKN